jgi:mono/diheme cytochrome c family protein
MNKKTLIAAMVAALIPLAARAEADKKTDRLWKAKCASCHGADGKADTAQGKNMAIGDISAAAWQKGHTDVQIKQAINEGVRRAKNGKQQEMDPYKDKLTPEQVDQLTAYVQALK